ncbi:predicted protein [Micromonas commoda]|uniref:Uncharacterized protein n=1 Tax=Micromonas commoda (strain RCC299 / NOUM17 / CCMP2709) TaxID=296587 RepID=C1EHW5_MICCC|nr:predicted protein [Micromonas commoda]ACO67754.1 predicted protein [Micromonas commoda]|eukprot:XP_002506496.1 predicted protein [Micromonas commoda]
MGDKGDASKLGASQPALVIGGVNPSGRKKRASFPPSARKLPPSAAAPTASNNNNGGGTGESHGLSDAEKAKIHGKINGAKALEASEKMRAYLENKARKQREAMERKYGVGSLSGGGKLSSDGSYHAAPREASSVTLGVGAEVKRAAAIAVEAGIRACTPESSAMLAQGLDGMLERDGSADLGSIPRVSPPRVAGFGTAKLARPPLSNRSSIKGVKTNNSALDGNRLLDARRPAPLAQPPSSVGSDGSHPSSAEATPTGHGRTGRGKHPNLNNTPGPSLMTPSANDPLLDPADVDSPGDFPSPAPSAAARYIGRPLGLHVTSPAAFGGMGSAESTPGLTPSEGQIGGREGGLGGMGGRAGEAATGRAAVTGRASPDVVRRMRLPTLSDVEDAARLGAGAGSGYDSPDDSFPDEHDVRFNSGNLTGAIDGTPRMYPDEVDGGTEHSDPGAPSPRSKALRLEEEHRAAARIQANARGHLVRCRMDRELRARRLALAAREMEEVRVYDGEDGSPGGGGDGVDEEAAAAAVAAAMLTRPGGGSIEALQRSVVDAVRGVDRAGASGGSSHLSADDTIARAADALTLSLTGSLPSSVGRTTGEGVFFDEDEGGEEDDGVGLDATELDAAELAAVAKMQASARDLLSKADDDAAATAAAAVSDGEAAAVAKMQASARLHLARS